MASVRTTVNPSFHPPTTHHVPVSVTETALRNGETPSIPLSSLADSCFPHNGSMALDWGTRTSQAFLANVPETDPRQPTLKLAMDELRKKDAPRIGYDYAAANRKLNHALAFYAMRPNLEYTAQMNGILKQIMPANLSPERSLGLPIRASDKCDAESE